MDAKIETETQDIATEIDNKINQFMIDSNLPESLKPYVKAAAWIGASIGVKDCAKAISEEYGKSNQILNEVFNAIK